MEVGLEVDKGQCGLMWGGGSEIRGYLIGALTIREVYIRGPLLS